MKILNKIWGVSLLALLLIVAAPHKSTAQDQYISEQDFYDNLAPYGTWVYDQQYGDVWVPNVDSDFRPYVTQGHWVLTEYGNTWVSDYPWGWATFHYGRWIYDDYYGWEWVPGYEWAPAWVSWRHGGGYYGWAPLMPGISVNLSFGNSYNVPDYYWAFAPQAYINSANIYNYYVPYNRTTNIIRRTTVVRNTFVRGGINYIAGPGAAEIQRYTKRRPSVYNINNSNRPGTITVQNRSVNMFRPSIRRASDARPERVVDANAYKQQNPNQSIARRGADGAAGFNRDNAAKLAAVARNSNDNNNVVRVNRPAANQQRNSPNQSDNRQLQRTPITQPALPQNDNRPVFTPNRGQDKQSNDLKQKEQQIRGEQQAVRQQRRDQIIRENQEAGLPQTPQPPSIYGQTPLQQQQMAVRDQKRQLQRQQQEAQQVQQNQQRLRFEQQKQAQQTAQQQQQAQQKEQQRQQAEQQRQAQQTAQQQQQAQQKEQQRQQAEQQRQAQQAAQQQQRQAAQQAQQAAQAQQKEQQRQQADQQRQAQQAQQAQQRQAAQQAQQQQREAQRAQQQQQQSQQRRPPVRPNQ